MRGMMILGMRVAMSDRQLPKPRAIACFGVHSWPESRPQIIPGRTGRSAPLFPPPPIAA
jgi:hypothetical protein